MRWMNASASPSAASARRATASTSSHVRPDGRGPHRELLGRGERGVGVGDLGRRLAHHEHARDVGAVARHRAAEVADDDVAVADDTRAGVVVRRRAVRTRADDGEVRPVVAVREHPVDELAAHVDLGRGRRTGRSRISAATASTAWAAARSAATSAASFTARSGPTTAWAGRHVASGDRGLQREGEARPRLVADREHPGRADELGHRPRPDPIVSDHGRTRARAEVGHPRRLELGDDERRLAVAVEHEHREPLERHRLVAGEVRAGRRRPTAAARRRRPRPSRHAPAPGARSTFVTGVAHAGTIATVAPSRAW